METSINEKIAREAADNRDIELEALPCPFCGSDQIQLNPIADGSWTLDCHTCGAGSGTNEKEFVLMAWNKRISLTEVLKNRGLDADKTESKIRERIAVAQPQRSEPHQHVFNQDGGACHTCGLTYTQIIQEHQSPQRSEQQEWTPDRLISYLSMAMGPKRRREAWEQLSQDINAELAAERQRREQVRNPHDVIKLRASDAMARIVDDMVERKLLDSRSALADARLDYGESFKYLEHDEQHQQLLSALAAIERLSSASFVQVSENIAKMVTDYVENGIKLGTDWRNGLSEIISKRLKRLQVGEDVNVDLSLLDDFKKDTHRLDWLEHEPADVIFTFKKSEGHKFFVTNFDGKQSDKSSLREAIDEAMK